MAEETSDEICEALRRVQLSSMDGPVDTLDGAGEYEPKTRLYEAI